MLAAVVGAFPSPLAAQPVTTVFEPTADTYVRRGTPNVSYGSAPVLELKSAATNNRVLVRFDLAEVAATLGQGTLVSAELELVVETNGGGWGTSGRAVDLHRLSAAWSEAGATWNCAADALPANNLPDCDPRWGGGSVELEVVATALHTDALLGPVRFDLTQELAALLAGGEHLGWSIERGAGVTSGTVYYASREGTPGRVPKLVVTYEPVAIPAEPPLMVLLSPFETRLYEEPVFELRWSDSDGIELPSLTVTLDGQDLLAACTVSAEGAICPSHPSPGGHVFAASIADATGAVATIELPFELILDTTPPTVTLISPAPDALLATLSARVSGSVSDDGRLQSVEVRGRPVGLVNGAFSVLVELAEGSQEILVQAEDEAGNVGTAAVTVRGDTLPPELRLSSPTSDTRTHLPEIVVSGTATDASGIDRVTIDGQPVALDGGAFVAAVALAEGPRTIVVEAFDAAGNVRRFSVEVERASAPLATITQPVPFAVLSSDTVELAGTIEEAAGGIASVVILGHHGTETTLAAISGHAFSASGVLVVEGRNLLTAVVTDVAGRVGTATVTVLVDRSGPQLIVEAPAEGAVLERSPIAVVGRVADPIGDAGAPPPVVTVAGLPATVLGTRFVADVALQPGENTVMIEAVDGAGNRTQVERRWQLVPRQGRRLESVDGERQRGPIRTPLPEPLVVRAVAADGTPVAGMPVIWAVRGNDGAFANGKRKMVVPTDTAGLSSIAFTLGSYAGAGTQVVEAAAVGYGAPVVFAADAFPGPPARLVMDAGNNQVGLTGRPLANPLLAVAVDDAGNRLAGIAVRWEVIAGGGVLETGLSAMTVTTDSMGAARATWMLGPLAGIAKHTVRATLEDGTGEPASFVASAQLPGNPQATAIAGVVLDATEHPVPGATVGLAGSERVTTTGEDGAFRLAEVPVGALLLLVDASTTSRPGNWPHLEFEIVTLPGIENRLDRPIWVLPLTETAQVYVSETEGGVITLPEVPGFALEIAPGSTTFPDGAREGWVSVTSVHTDRVPMEPNFGQQPRFVITIQPAGAIFDPPAPMTLPNLDGLAPGKVTEMYSFDHDLGRFVAIGNGTVSDDGLVIVSNPGTGVVKAGWHCGGDPARNTGTPHECPECHFCVEETCQPANAGTCDDEERCTVLDRCREGQCEGLEIVLEEIDGPCLVAVNEDATFRAELETPTAEQHGGVAVQQAYQRVSWASGGMPSSGTGGAYTTRWGSVGFASVSVGCRSMQNKTVAVEMDCDSVVPELSHTSECIESDEIDALGTHKTQYALTVPGCVKDGRFCYRLQEMQARSKLSIASALGGTIALDFPTSDVIGPGNCKEVIEDLTPRRLTTMECGVENEEFPLIAGGAPRPRWCKYLPSLIVKSHEQFHEADYNRNVVTEVFKAMNAFITEYECSDCLERVPYNVFHARLQDIEYDYRKSWACCTSVESCTRCHEFRAYSRDTNPLSDLFISLIRDRARLLNWPEECQ